MSHLICSICINNLISDDNPVCSTMCGHLFHSDCWSKWAVNGSQFCPKCQILNGSVMKLYPDKEEDGQKENRTPLQDDNDILKAKLNSALEEIEYYENALKQSEENFLLLSGQYSELELKCKLDKENRPPAQKVMKRQKK